MHLKYESFVREPLVDGEKTYHQVTEDIVRPIEQKPGKLWYIGFFFSVSLLLFGVFSVAWAVYWGLGVWGVNRTVGWGWDITNFVWWVGIGHAGTLISAILLLFRQGWRTGVNRAAEAMTIFAVMCAGQFPIFHMGRVWDGFFVLPYPNSRGALWPNFNSPLLWDVFAISTYFTVSLLFWYSGLIPDFATVRDRAKTKLRKLLYGVASFGWTGSAKSWQRHEALSLVLAGLATPLVLSVHTIVSFDFATSVIPGWHTTIFPPYFVAGAIFSGFAMVQTLLIVCRRVMDLEEYITIGHLEAMNKVIVLTGSIVGVAYLTELFMAWYSQVIYEQAAFQWRIAGPQVKTAHIHVQAPAKINLILRVLGRRPDGYHDVWSLMQTVALYDDLRIAIQPADSPGVELRCNEEALPVDQSNLVFRAAALVLERAGHPVRLSIELEKRIPMGAGLGGGSSDAAATVVALNYLLELGWSRSMMAEIGQILGSDVPFFFAAPTAVATGRGERVQATELEEGRWVLLVNPGFAVDTAWAYRQLSASRQAVLPIPEPAKRLEREPVLKWETIIEGAANDFEDPVYGPHPILREIKDALVAAGADMALLSGSGATVFGIFRDHARASRAQAVFSRNQQCKVFLVETCRQPLLCR